PALGIHRQQGGPDVLARLAALGERAGTKGLQDLPVTEETDLVEAGAGDDRVRRFGAAGGDPHVPRVEVVHTAFADLGVDERRESRSERHRRRMVAVLSAAEKSLEGTIR